MTYVSKREKIFGLPDCAHLDCSPPIFKRSEGRLKEFSSVTDDRAWSLNEKERYSCLYYLVTGSRTCLEKFWCHKYVPLEDLLNLLLAEKNEYIKKLERQAAIGPTKKNLRKDKPIDELFVAESFEDDEEEEEGDVSHTEAQKKKQAEREKLTKIAVERDNLQRKLIELQNELIATREKQNKLMRENDCCKKKLMTMKCLEREVQELKIEANTFADKYKKDLEFLREERNKLKKRVNELTKYELQHNDLKSKLQQVDYIIAENEMLNTKLASLTKFELENELLRCRLEQCQLFEMEAAESKEKIIELQCAVADQEEEMKDLLCQIEKLTRAYDEGNELDKLKEELSEKVSKLKLCEERLAEIPFLEAEINELRSKLGNQFEQSPNVATINKKVVSDEEAEDELTEVGARYEESVNFKKHSIVLEDIKAEETLLLEMADKYEGKDSMTCEEVQNLLQASKGIIRCVLEDMIEHQREMQELEKCNREMKKEIQMLKAAMGKSDKDVCLQQVAKLNLIIQEKEKKLCCLEQKLKTRVDREEVNDQLKKLECEVEYLRETNNRMRNDMEEACRKIQRCAELERMLEEERCARAASETKDADLSKMQKEEFNLEAKESFSNDTDHLRNQIDEMNKLIEKLKNENASLKETIQTCPDIKKELDEKHALEALLNLLQNELDSCRQNTSHDRATFHRELKKLKNQNFEPKTLGNCNKEKLELEKKSSKEGSSKKATVESTRCFKDRSSKTQKEKCSKCLGEASSRNAKECGCKAQRSVSSKSNVSENENKLRTEVTQLHCEIATLCAAIYEKERQICNQSKQIVKLKACIKNVMRNLIKKRDELLKKMDDRVPKEMDENLEKEMDKKSQTDINENQQQEKGEKLEKEGEEKLQKDEEEKLRIEKEKQVQKENEEKLQKEEEEELQKVEEGKLQKVEEGKLQKEEEEKLQKVEEGKLQKEEEGKLQKEEEEKLQKVEEEKLQKEEEEGLQKEKEQRLLTENAENLQGKLEKSERMELENVITNLKSECDGLQKKLKECQKAETERDSLLQKQASMDLEIKKLEKLLAECTGKDDKEKISAKEDKLLEEMSSIRQQSAIYQEEANNAKAMNNKLKNEVQELKKLLESCKRERANEAVPSPSVPPASLEVTSSVLPTVEKQKVLISDEVTTGIVTEEKVDKPTELAAAEKPVKDIMSEKTTSPEALRNKEKPISSQVVTEKEPEANTPVVESDSEIDISEVDPNFQNFLCSLNPFDHKRNICEIERRYKKKMCEFNRKYNEKVKLLVDEFEKDRNLRDKMFNDSMSNVKSGYETDIRKLVEKHKASIMRLQSLHEEEVQELNVNYETQMEAIQNQSENVVNDLTNRVAEKFKKLAEQHNEDLREVEKKYEKLLREKEMQHVGKLSKSQSKANQNIEEHHDDQGMPVDAHEKYNRQMKKLKQSNQKRMNIIKHAYEDLLMCERKKYEKQLEDVVQRLKEGKSLASGICQCRFESSCGPKDPNTPLELNEVLVKILTEGLASLTFNEVALVHRITCAAAEDIILNPDMRVELLPPIAVNSCERFQVMNAKKGEFLKKIVVLEKEIAAKKAETQDAINNMELPIQAMRKRLQELRGSLQSEKRKNSTSKYGLPKPKLTADSNTWDDVPERNVVKLGCEYASSAGRKRTGHRRKSFVHGGF